MAESKRRARKDLSDSDESPSVNQKKIKGTSTAPLCKYGAQCYRKHPDHLRAFRHPSPSPEPSEDDDDDDNPASKATTTACSLSPSKATASSSSATTTTMTLLELSELHGEKLLSHLYEMEFPRDLYEFWQFCSMINKKKPRDALKILLNLELVNPFEVLDGRLNACKTLPNIHLQYRYVYDTPEFMTLIRSTEQSSQFHIGYYR